MSIENFDLRKHSLFDILACVCMCAAIGCLTRQSVDAVHCPYLTSVSDGSTNPGQLNATHSSAADSELSRTLQAADVSRSLPVATESQCVVTAAGQLQLDPVSSATEDQSVDQLPRLTQYPLSDVSSVLAEQTLVGSRPLCADCTEVSQYLLSDSSSDGSRRAAELVSLLQFRLNDSPDNITATVHRETNNTAVMDSSSSHVRLPESSMQHVGEHVSQCLLTETSADNTDETDQHGGSCVTSDNVDAADVNIISSGPADVHCQGKCDGDVDLLVSAVTSISRAAACSLPTITSVDFSKRTSNNLVEPDHDNQCLALGTGPFTLSHMIQAGTVADKTDLYSAILTAVSPQSASYYSGIESVSVPDTGPKTSSSGADIIGTVADSSSITVSLPEAGSTTRLRDEKLSDSGWLLLPVSIEPGRMHQVDASSDVCETAAVPAAVDCNRHDLGLPPSQTHITSVRKPVTDDKEQTNNQPHLLLMETLGTDTAKCLRNMADGSEALDKLSVVQTAVHANHSIAAHSGRYTSGIAQYVIDNVSDDAVNDEYVTAEQSGTVVQGRSVDADNYPRDSVVCDTDSYKAETLANIEGQLQHLTMTTEKPSELALPLEQDSGSELDGDDLAEDVKMILAKYRIRRAPIGSDSMPATSSANVDNVLIPNVVEPLLKDTSTAQDLDTCSSSSDDTLANRVQALLIKVQKENDTGTLPTTASNVTSESVSRVHSVRSSQTSSVDYSILSRELNEIEMNLDSMRNCENSSSGSQYVSDGSSRICSRVVDELLATLLQQKSCLDQLLQYSSVSHAGDYVEDTVSSIGAQNLQHFYSHKLADGQNVTDTSKYAPDLSGVEDAMLETISEVSSMHTDMHQSDSTNCTQLGDCGSVCSDNTGVEAAVKQLKQNLSDLLQSESYDISPSSSAYSYIFASELLKQSSSEATADQQIPESYDDEHHLGEAALSGSYSASCDLSPVPKHNSLSTVNSAHPLSSQLNNADATLHFDRSTELQFSAACNDQSSSQSFGRNVQQTENPSQLRIECERQKGYSNEMLTEGEDGRWPHMQESCSVSSNKEMLAFNSQFVSAAGVQFTPLAQVPREGDSSDNASCDGDNELPLIGQQSRDDNSEVQSYGRDPVAQQLSVDKTLDGSNDANVSVSFLDADHSAQMVASYSPASINLLQPYQ